MSDASQVADSLMVEHLRWTPLSMIDDIINSINELLYRAVEAVESGLLAAPPSSLGFESSSSTSNGGGTASTADGGRNETLSSDARFEIENGVHQLETLLESSVDRNFDKLEIYLLRGVFVIPPEVVRWVRLAHYENLQFPPPPDAPTQASVALQRRKLRETERLHAALVQEQSRNAALLAQLRRVLPPASSSTSDADPSAGESAPFAYLTSHPLASSLSLPTTTNMTTTSTHRGRPLTTTTQFLTSQLPALRSLLASLRPSLQTLSHPVDQTATTETAAQRTERTRYIEDRVRRHLERTGRGLDVEGEEWVGGGRRVKGREVEGLEGVVGMLGEPEDHTDVKEDEEMDA